MNNNKIFFSCSGNKSKKFAELFKEFLKSIDQTTDIWISTTGIEKGTAWFTETGNTIKDIDSSIVFLTENNQNSAWLLFESGAFYKGDNKNNIYTFLINLNENEIDTKSPFYHFNHTKFNKDDIKKLVEGISRKNKKLRVDDFSETKFNEYFERDWEIYESKFQKVIDELEDIENDSPKEKEITENNNEKNKKSKKNMNLELLNELYETIYSNNVPFSVVPEIFHLDLRKMYNSKSNFIDINSKFINNEYIEYIKITKKGLNYLANNR